jgi:hypothetical protein
MLPSRDCQLSADTTPLSQTRGHRAVQHVRYLAVDSSPRHVAVLGHADVGVAEVIGADSSGKSFVVESMATVLRELCVVVFGDPLRLRTGT